MSIVVNNKKRLYAKEMYISKNEEMIVYCEMLKYIEERDKELFIEMYKKVCNIVRKHIDINNVIGLAMNENNDEVAVYVYDAKADDNFYIQYFDKEKKIPYIEIEEEKGG
jgi:hypothetical protein